MSNTQQSLTSIDTLGEFGLIDHLTRRFLLRQASSLLGVGDDAAILHHGNEHTVLTTDLLIEGIHFDLAYAPLRHLGYKSVVVNLSDVYAMNATPRQITVSIAMSNRFSLEALDELYEGIRLACEFYNVDLVGGDTSSSTKGLIISITALGSAPAEKIVKRSGAKPNDLICVTGNLGAAYMGLQLLEREKQIYLDTQVQPQIEQWDYIVARQLKPEARHDLVSFFAEQQIQPSAMIDISDGLSSELLHLAKQSGSGMKVFEDKLPVHEQTADMAQEFQIDPSIAALNGGEDYELLFTISPEAFDTLGQHPDIHIIGHVLSQPESYLIARDGTAVPLQAQGWNHTA